MKTYLICFSVLVSVLLGRALHAQVPPEFPKSQPEHKWLQQFVGQWDSELESKMGPDQPTMKCKLAISSRMLGDFWVVNELSGDMMGTPMVGIQTIGYDTEKNAYVGTWVDSMMNHMWKYEGSVDESGKLLTLEAEGPNFMAAGKTTKFRDAYEFKSADHIVATSSLLTDDGKWVVFMTGQMHRTKPAK